MLAAPPRWGLIYFTFILAGFSFPLFGGLLGACLQPLCSYVHAFAGHQLIIMACKKTFLY
jgi:hypothetical protein